MKISGKNILLISPDSWGSYYLSKHHYALELSKENNVFFLNAPNADLSNEGLSVINTRSEHSIQLINYKNLAQKLAKQLPKLDIVWCFDLHRFPNLKVFEADLHVFHPVDLYKSKIVHQIVASADIVFATADEIIEKISLGSTPAYTINHGLANSFLEPKAEIIEEIVLPGNNKLKAALVGNPLHKHLSQISLFKVIQEHPEIDFYFIGPVRQNREISAHNLSIFEKIKEQKNTYYLGRKEYWQLKPYMSLMDVLLICYDRENNLDAPPNPHKLLEYLSVGKAIVSNYFKTYESEKHLINMAPSLADYSAVFKETIDKLVLYNDSKLVEERRELAFNHSYQKQLGRIGIYLEKHKLLLP